MAENKCLLVKGRQLRTAKKLVRIEKICDFQGAWGIIEGKWGRIFPRADRSHLARVIQATEVQSSD